MKDLLQLRSNLSITLFIASMKDQSAAVSAWVLRCLLPHTPSLVSPHPRELQLALSHLFLCKQMPSSHRHCCSEIPTHEQPQLWLHYLDYISSLLPSILPFDSHKHHGSLLRLCPIMVLLHCLGNTWCFLWLSVSSMGRNGRPKAA